VLGSGNDDGYLSQSNQLLIKGKTFVQRTGRATGRRRRVRVQHNHRELVPGRVREEERCIAVSRPRCKMLRDQQEY